MSTPIKVFSKVYVSLKEQYCSSVDDSPPFLGFLTPYEENAAGKKRIETADKWATPFDHYAYDHIAKKQVLVKKGEAIPPRILDNVPLEGFEICREVKRTGWHGGNVVWRVLDPRGFELEISSSNLAKILTFATIEAGTIKSKCIWGRLGASNLLIPEGCPEFANIIPKAEEYSGAKSLAGKIIPISEIAIGDFVKLSNMKELVYLGKWNILVDENDYSMGGKTCVRHILFDQEKYFAISELKVIEKIKSSIGDYAKYLTIDNIEKMLNKVKRLYSFGSSADIEPRLVSKEKIDIEKVKVVKKEFDKATFIDHITNSKMSTHPTIPGLLDIFDFNKTKRGNIDYLPLTLTAKLKTGQSFIPRDLEIAWPRQPNFSVSQKPLLDVRLLLESAGQYSRIPQKGFITYRNRKLSEPHLQKYGVFVNSLTDLSFSQDLIAYNRNNKGASELVRQEIIQFFNTDVDSIYYYDVEYLKSNGEILVSTVY